MDVSAAPPSLRLHRHTEVPHAVELMVPDRSYAAHGPPRLFNYLTRDPDLLSWFPEELLRTTIACPDEYVIRLRNVHVVHGHYLILYPDSRSRGLALPICSVARARMWWRAASCCG